MTAADPPIPDREAFKTLEHDGWVEVANRYHDAFSPLTRQAIEPLLDAAGVVSGAHVLDVACGPGYVAAAAVRRGARASGVDFSTTMVEEARRRHPGVEFAEGDAEALAFPDALFDAVTINFGILHFADPDRALAEARRVLRPGGRLAFTVWDLPERAVTFGLVLAAIQDWGNPDVPLPAGPPFFRFADPAESSRSLEAAGFSAPRVRALPLAWRQPSADALLEIFLEGGVRTRALLRAQTPDALERIRAALRVAVRAYERDGALELPTPAVLSDGLRPAG